MRQRQILLPRKCRSKIERTSYIYGLLAVLCITIGCIFFSWGVADFEDVGFSDTISPNTISTQDTTQPLPSSTQDILPSTSTELTGSVSSGDSLSPIGVNTGDINTEASQTGLVSSGTISTGTYSGQLTNSGSLSQTGIISGEQSPIPNVQSGLVATVLENPLTLLGTTVKRDTQVIDGQEVPVEVAIDTILRGIKRMKIKSDLMINDKNVRAFLGNDSIVTPAEGVLQPSEITIEQNTTDATALSFMFGVADQHLIFSKPVEITLDLPTYVDGKQVPIYVKHEGDAGFNIQGLSIDPQAGCNADGSSTNPSNIMTVMGGEATFYTCGASFFQVGYTGSNTAADFTDNTMKVFTATVITGVNMPTGAIIKDISVIVDWQPIAGNTPTAPGAGNCYPNEKGFSLRSPQGTQVTLLKTGTLVSSQSACPRALYTFVITGVQHGTTVLASGTYRADTGWNLTGFLNQNPFGNWTLRMQDTAAADGVILRGFKVLITGNNAPTNMTLSGSTSIYEGNLSGVTIGSLSSTDVDVGDSFSYTFDTTCAGVLNNTDFSLSGNILRAATVFDFPTQSGARRVCLRTTDSRGGLYTGLFNISVLLSGYVSPIAPNTLSIPSLITTSLSSQTIDYVFSGSVNDAFQIVDTKGIDSGYMATLQLSGDLVSSGGDTILASSVGIIGTPPVFLVTGVANTNVQPSIGASSPFRALSSIQSFLRRNPGTNAYKRGIYGVYLPLRINIPAAQPAGSYTSTLVFTVIEN